MTETVYLDASAIVKLVVAEPESTALRARLAGTVDSVSSAIVLTEAARAVRRVTRTPRVEARLAEVLDRIARVSVAEPILRVAAAMGPPELRTLDAIHLATALSLGGSVNAFLTYDSRLATAAAEAGLAVESPT